MVDARGETLLQSLDQTIADGALPYLPGQHFRQSRRDHRMLIPMSRWRRPTNAAAGWQAIRFGREPLRIGCIIGFTIASLPWIAIASPR
jgi:MFS transporter, DHA2 family, multidrug resistance protein